ncbi:hypothetical protein CEXT_322001, partial [Caerostris extrusa]
KRTQLPSCFTMVHLAETGGSTRDAPSNTKDSGSLPV